MTFSIELNKASRPGAIASYTKIIINFLKVFRVWKHLLLYLIMIVFGQCHADANKNYY